MIAMLDNIFTKRTPHKMVVVLVASGLGLRMQALTGGLFPKILCTIGQETLLSRILKNIEPICTKLHIICNSTDKNILQKWIETNHTDIPFNVNFFVHEEPDGSWNAIKHFSNSYPDICECLLHWSDISYPFDANIPTSDNDSKVFVYATNKPMNCRFGIGGNNVLCENNDAQNVVGFYQCINLRKTVGILDLVATQMSKYTTYDFADLLSAAQSYDVPVRLKRFKINSSKLIDNGDIQKHRAIMKKSSNQVRYFNGITVLPDRIVKYSKNERGVNVMHNEIEFYRFMHDFCGTILPTIYTVEDNQLNTMIEMERIHGFTIHDYLNNGVKPVLVPSNTIEDNAIVMKKRSIVKKVFALLDMVHAVKQEPLVDLTSNPSVLKEYYHSVFSRVAEIKAILPQDVKCNIVTYDIESENCNPSATNDTIDMSENVFIELMNRWKAILAKTNSVWCTIHGDPNTKNMMIENATERLVLIDPRGVFGDSAILGELTYDFAKLIYGLHSYSHFNHELVCTIDINTINSRKICEFNMTKFTDMQLFDLMEFVYRYHNANTPAEKRTIYWWYVSLIGIIYIKLTGYIKNDPTKSIYAYVYGTYLLKHGIEHLEKNEQIKLFF